MSETKHSPEPWHYVGDSGAIEDDAGHMCAEGWGAGEAEDANARRIVACVNALAGVPTVALEAGALAKVLEALEDIAEMHGGDLETAAPVVARDALRALGKIA